MEKRYQSYVEESKIQQIENIKKHEEEVRQFNSDQVSLYVSVILNNLKVYEYIGESKHLEGQ